MNFYLSEIKSKDDLKNLFIEQWNWEAPRISKPIFDFSTDLADKIIDLQVIAEKQGYKIFLLELKDIQFPEKNLKIIERKIINYPEFRQIVNDSIFIFLFQDFDYIDFVRAEKTGPTIKIKKFSISPENKNKLRTPCEQLEKLRLSAKELSQSKIKQAIDQAFNTDLVTEEFYHNYISTFQKIKESLKSQKTSIDEPEKKLRDFIHQLLNRIMFLYFVQKRGSFENDKNFLANFWDNYKNKHMGENEFHIKWLNILFFEALSKPSWLYLKPEPKYLENYNEIFKNSPYLNGGLFEENEDLDDVGWIIPDDLFDDIFDFFESYNFTIEESTRLDIEIAINPEMLGNIYEHLINVEEQEERSRAGIFYTQETEIELMIKRSLVEFLYQKTKIKKDSLYQFIFKEEAEEIKIPFGNSEAELVLTELDNIILLDPACGSGHYLIVAVRVLCELKEILWKFLNKNYQDKYTEKKRIIERNIYGNDIKKWATEVARLRLWLDLFIDADLERLKDQREPILPNLGFKIRYGDSLIQRLGNRTIPLRNINHMLEDRNLLSRLKHLIQQKHYVYELGNIQDFKNVLNEEKNLLLNAIKIFQIRIKQEIQNKESLLRQEQFKLFEEKKEIKKEDLFKKQTLQKINELQLELNDLEKYRAELVKENEPPMIWDLAFAEVFKIKNGFDIVIANPPYVRQELISDINEVSDKKDYKDLLIRQTILDWSYNYKGQTTGSPFEKLDKKSDLYVYFYLKGLKLLNSNGVLCYISSNSWLDVGYGAKLQEILIRRVPIVAIYDNQAKRSFKHADINTIIVILKAPKDQEFDEEIKNNSAKFVMFKKPFDDVLYSEIFIELENNEGMKKLPEGQKRENEIYKIHEINQKELFEYGKDQKIGLYAGNKWGGKYLRAPDIYWTILDKGGLNRSIVYERERESKTRSAGRYSGNSSRVHDRGKRVLLSGRYHGQPKLVRLGDIADVRFGIKTGANEFFYLEDVTDKVEEG